jgi:hypothetical protein
LPTIRLANASRKLLAKKQPQTLQPGTKFRKHGLAQVQRRIQLVSSRGFLRQAIQDGHPSPAEALQLLVCKVAVETVPAPGQPKSDGLQGFVGHLDHGSGEALGKRSRASLCEHWLHGAGQGMDWCLGWPRLRGTVGISLGFQV